MKWQLVSIIVPVYNIERFVGRCLESLIGQTYGNIEIIVVDDGSTDGSSGICDEMAQRDKRVKVFHKKNGGLSDARNFGIRKAHGEIVALVDGDDYVEMDYIEVMAEAMFKNDADVVVCGFNDKSPKTATISGNDAVKRLLIGQENMEIVAWNKLYKKKLFVDNDIWYPIGEKNEDNLTTYKLLAAATKVGYVDKSLYHYVERKGSIMDEAGMEDRLMMRWRAAVEAAAYFRDSKELRQPAEIVMLLAKYAFMDAAIRGEISTRHYEDNLKWVRKHRKEYAKNDAMTWKLKFYNALSTVGLYRVFRTII